MAWEKHWNASKLESEFGERIKHPHVFPEDFPQAKTVEAWIYPIGALPNFRVWMYSNYVPQNFPSYLQRKVKAGTISPATAQLAIESVNSKSIETS